MRCRAWFLCFRYGPAHTQAVDCFRVEPKVFENFFIVLSKRRSAPCGYFGDAMHLNRTADRRGQLAACAFERHDDVIRPQLRIVHDFLRPAHGAKRDVNAIEHLIPMRHRLRAEDFIENCRQLRHVLNQLRRIRESRIRQEIRAANCFRHGG